MRIGFIGLGTMGKPMAEHLRKAGHTLIAYNRSAGRAKDWEGVASVTIVSTPAEAAAQSETVYDAFGRSGGGKRIFRREWHFGGL